MICEIMLYSSVSLNVAKITILLLLNIIYLFRHAIFKWCILFLFRRCKYGNISFIEKSALLKPDLTLEQVEKEVLNVVNNPNDPSVILYITNEKFYENFLFYGEQGLEKSYDVDFHTKHLYGLFEIMYAPPTCEWAFHKTFVNAFNANKNTKNTDYDKTLIYNDDEFLFYVDENTEFSSEEIKIVVHNGNFNFKNTSMEISKQSILTDQEISKKFVYKKLERISPVSVPDKTYYRTFLNFLFEHNYLSYNYYFL